MRQSFLILILWLLSSLPASADGPYTLWFPLIEPLPHYCEGGAKMGYWKIAVPETTTNKVLNPSDEITGNFAAEAGTTVTRVTTFQHYGLYSYRVETNANNEGIELTLSALANAIHYVTVRVRGTLPTTWDWSLNDSTFTSPTLIEQIDSDWALYGLQFSAAQSNGSTKLSIHQNGSGSGDFYLDGIQVEEKSYWTTYCDGSQEGCEWNGAANASASTRSAASRAGGRIYDLEDDYGLRIGGMSGTGTSPQELFVDSYSQLPGGELNAIKTNSRIITLSGVIEDDSWTEFHAKKQALKSILSKDAVPQDALGFQPVRLRYTGAAVHKEIAVHYEGGLEGNIVATDPCYWERVAVRFIAPQPYWYEIGESAALLDTNDSATFRVVAGRLRSTGQWSALGPPNSSGTYNNVRAIAEDATYVYIGGNFLNFDNIANADHIVRYNKQTGAYSAMGSGMNDSVYALTIAPDGTLYAAGDFTTAGGGGANRIASWNGSAWSALGTGLNDIGFAVTISPSGAIIAGGNFTTAGGGAAVRVASWDGSAWSALGSGMNDTVFTLAYGLDGNLYAGGIFTTAGGGAASKVASWDGSAWSALGSGMNSDVIAIVFRPDGILYAAGAFNTAGGITANEIASWNGSAWSALGEGLNDTITGMSLGADGVLYVGGIFTTAGGITLSDRVAKWNGSAWSHLDLDLPGSPNVYQVFASKYADPVVPQKYSLYLGFDTAGTGAFAGSATASNDGTVPAFPKIIFNRSGGTTATIQSVRNERNGQEILFNYALLNGETLTIDLSPTKKSIVSNFFGSRQDAILKNSDFGDWQLLSGSNQITSFVSTSGSPTVTAYLLYKDQFDSQD